jgi:tripartite-type tricarboxylate transporter receptor subunit TctC
MLFLFSSSAKSEDYPNKLVSLIVPYAAGGSTDTVARALAKSSAKHFPVPVVFVNQAGGAGIPGRVAVVNAKK